MNKVSLEIVASDCLKLGRKARETDIDAARGFFGFSYGLYLYLGKYEFVDLCSRLLKSTGLTEYGANLYEKSCFERVINLVTEIIKTDLRREQQKHI